MRWHFVLMLSAALLGAAPAAAQDASAEKLLEAQDLLARGQSDLAIAAAESAVALATARDGENHPRTLVTRLGSARIRFQAGEAEGALASLDDTIQRTIAAGGAGTRLHATLLSEHAKIAIILGRLDLGEAGLVSAMQIYETVGAAPGELADIFRGLGIVRSEGGHPGRARADFAAAVEHVRDADQGPERLADALMDRAGAEILDEDIAAAEATLAEVRRLLPAPSREMQARLLVAEGRIEQARSRLERSERLLRDALSKLPEQSAAGVLRAQALYSLGTTLSLRGDALQAERILRQAIREQREFLDADHPAIGRSLLGLGLVYEDLGQPSLAIELIERAIAIFSAASGPDSLPPAEARVEYAMILRDLDEPAAAITELDLAAPALAAAGPDAALRRAYAASARGFVLEALGRDDAAAESLEAAVAGMLAERGEDSSDLPPPLIKLAEIYARQGRHEAARERLLAAQRIIERDNSRTPRLLGAALAAEARLLLAEGAGAAARQTANELVEMMRARLDRDGGACGFDVGEQRAARRLFETAVDAFTPVGVTDDGARAAAFEAAQYPHLGETARTLAQSAELGDPKEAGLRRRLRDLAAERCALETAILDSLGGATGQVKLTPGAIESRLAEIAAEESELTAKLAAAGDEHGSLLEPQPVSAGELAGVLRTGEALLVQLTTESGTHLFLLLDGSLHHARTGLDATELATHVEALRSALTLGPGQSYAGLPDFPVRPAHALYQGLFAPFAELLAGSVHVFFVPDREMRALPPSVLLRSAPAEPPSNFDFEALAALDFLTDHIAFSILPAPDALLNLRGRQHGRGDIGTAFFGVGDPLLGPHLPPVPESDRPADLPVEGASEPLMRSDGTAAPTVFRSMVPLPETRDELVRLAEALGADPVSSVLLGADATEAGVRNSQPLSEARVVAFATHGLVSGEFGGLSEPALVLTPVADSSPDDDGLLTTSEIAELSLRADWVVLSACNTAAGRHPRAEGLSGLARAFMHAGARGLMVSHWYVPSEAAAALTVFAGQALGGGAAPSRARALQAAMERVRRGEHPDGKHYSLHAHPLFWAPFVTVGDAV